MDMTLIQATISGLKTASDLTKGFLELKSITEVQTKVIELQSVILSAQASALSANADQFSAVEEIRALKAEIAQMKTWEAEKQRYKLHTPWEGAFTYALKKSMSNGEPAHWICANCYQNGKKAFLDQVMFQGSRTHFSCPSCKSQFTSPHRGETTMQFANE